MSKDIQNVIAALIGAGLGFASINYLGELTTLIIAVALVIIGVVVAIYARR